MNSDPAHDTIVAVSSAAGRSPRAIIRLSGPKAVEWCRKMAGIAELPATGFHSFRAELSLGDSPLPAVLYVMRKPASYTREDVVEFHIFGNPALQQSLLRELESLGARPAAPGEFTRRAFLNGRIDLAQAEAVEALIHAHGEAEYRAAQEVLSGRPGAQFREIHAELVQLSALVEVSLDFSDQDVEIISHEDAIERIAVIRESLRLLSEGEPSGRVRKESLRVALFGPPNAGKSSIFNALLAKQRAIVSPHPGTTRDTIEAVLMIDGIEATLIDTAGIRAPADLVEAAAIQRSHDTLLRADLGLCILDASMPITPDVRKIIKSLSPARTIFLLNKSDLPTASESVHGILPESAELRKVSALTGQGISEVLACIRERVESGAVDRRAGSMMVSARQAHLIGQALQALDRALDDEREPLMDLLAGDIREALNALSEFTGENAGEAILDHIFDRFCIGK